VILGAVIARCYVSVALSLQAHEMMTKLYILVCAEKLETYFSLLHQNPRTETNKHSKNGKRSH